ncbi:TPA: hypothetical protein U2L31_003131 [Burkholderia contaminans]|nr:hypothetical protein [Burkholderia contaminans]
MIVILSSSSTRRVWSRSGFARPRAHRRWLSAMGDVMRIQFESVLERGAVEQLVWPPFTRVAHGDDPFALGLADRHDEQVGDAMPCGDLSTTLII